MRTLAELKAKFDSGALEGCVLVLDNDQTFVYSADGERQLFEAHPHDVLRSALDMLGIPWDEA